MVDALINKKLINNKNMRTMICLTSFLMSAASLLVAADAMCEISSLKEELNKKQQPAQQRGNNNRKKNHHH